MLTSVTAAYLPRNLRPVVSSITVHPPGAVFQRPFSTGELEIAGFEDNTSDGRPQTPSSSASSASSSTVMASPALGRRIYQKGLQTFVWKADDENDDRLELPTCSIAVKGTRPGNRSSGVCGIPFLSGTRPRCPMGPTT